MNYNKFMIIYFGTAFGILALLLFIIIKFAPENKIPEKFTNESGQTTEFFHSSEFEKWHKENLDIEVICESQSGSYIMIIYKKKPKNDIQLKFKDIELTHSIFKPC